MSLVVGKMNKIAISPMSLAGQEIKWCDQIKYLGIYLARGRALKFDVNALKKSFYTACNLIFSHSDGISEIALLNLQEAYSLSVLMYASPALALQSQQISELNACWNNVIRRIFGYKRWESVKAVIFGLGRLNVTYEFIVRKLKFYKRSYLKSVCLHDVFWAAMLSDRSDDCLRSVLFHSV